MCYFDGLTMLFTPPHPIEVRHSPINARLNRMEWNGVTYTITQIVQTWEVDTGWWEASGRSWRRYYAVTTSNGHLCVLYEDAVSGEWYLSRLDD